MKEIYAQLETPLKEGNFRVSVYKYNSKKEKMDMYDVCEGSHRDIDKWLYNNYPTAKLKNISGEYINSIHDIM